MNTLQSPSEFQSLSFVERTQAALIRELMQQTDLPLSDVARHLGLDSIRALQNEVHRLFGALGVERRGEGPQKKPRNQSVTIELPVQGAYDFDWVFNYLSLRRLQGIEEVAGHCYRRRVSAAGESPLWVEVSENQGRLSAVLPLTCGPIEKLVGNIVRLFDLAADSDRIDQVLSAVHDSAIASSVGQAPGLRVPGAWDGFETVVRAVLGQQVSVARGTELANRMVDAYGGGDFPTPAQLKDREIAELGMPGNRGRAIAILAERVEQEAVELLEGQVTERFVQEIGAVKGIGPWTQNYMRLRVVKDSDAFPHNDWVVLKQLETTPAQARKIAECWRPCRAYALMHIWRIAGLRRLALKER